MNEQFMQIMGQFDVWITAVLSCPYTPYVSAFIIAVLVGFALMRSSAQDKHVTYVTTPTLGGSSYSPTAATASPDIEMLSDFMETYMKTVSENANSVVRLHMSTINSMLEQMENQQNEYLSTLRKIVDKLTVDEDDEEEDD